MNDQKSLKMVKVPKTRATKNKTTTELIKELSHLIKIVENRLKKL